jgi:hypothetical protein
MDWHVVEVRPTGDLKLNVRFRDGISGVVRFDPISLTGVFERLRDKEVFRQVFVDHGAVAWPGEIELAPDAMHRAIAKTGEFVVSRDLVTAGSSFGSDR